MLLSRLPNHIKENIWTTLPLRLGSTKYRSSFNRHIYRRLLRYIQHNFTESLNRRLQINHTTGNRARYIPITPFNRRYNSSVFLNWNRLKDAHFRAFFYTPLYRFVAPVEVMVHPHWKQSCENVDSMYYWMANGCNCLICSSICDLRHETTTI